MGGKGQGTPEASQAQQRIAMDLYGQTDPLRKALIQRSSSFLGVPQPEIPPITGSSQPTKADPGTPWLQPDNPFYKAPQAAAPAQQAPSTPISGFGSQGLDISRSALYDPFKIATEDAYRQAKDSLAASGVSGGALGDLMTKIETDRAKSSVQNQSRIAEQELNNAMGLSNGYLGTTMSGLSGAAAAQAQAQQAAAQESAGKGNALGTMMGSYFGGKG